MKLNFIVNDYLLVWNLLFSASINEEIHEFKQKLWMKHKEIYSNASEENKLILKDIKNFIPDNDILYNEVINTQVFKNIKKETEAHRLFLMKSWDANKKIFCDITKQILKTEITEGYNIIVVHPEMNAVYYDLNNKEKNIVWGRKSDTIKEVATLISILYTVIRYKVGVKNKESKEIVQSVLELAIHNEFYTRFINRSTYLSGDSSLSYLKRQIYPYWIMYLGADEDNYTKYMMRDKIAFDIDKYPAEIKLKKCNLFEFIDYCIIHEKHIIRMD